MAVWSSVETSPMLTNREAQVFEVVRMLAGVMSQVGKGHVYGGLLMRLLPAAQD